MNDYSRQNCRGCVHENKNGWDYCLLFKVEPEDHCKHVEFPPPTSGRPPRVPNPPTKPVA